MYKVTVIYVDGKTKMYSKLSEGDIYPFLISLYYNDSVEDYEWYWYESN